MSCIPWSDKEIEALKTLINAGYKAIDILLVFPARSPDSIRNKMLNLGLKAKKLEAEIDVDRFNALMEARR